MPYVNYAHKPIQPKKSRKPLIIGLIVLATFVALASWFVFGRKKAEAPQTAQSTEVKTDEDVKSITAKYLFSGTVVPARAVENEARRADGTVDYDQPFSKFGTFTPEQYDAWTIDMECPVTDANIPYRFQVDNTVFNCRPEFLPSMAKYFTVMNLANNHVYDQGRDEFPQMQKYIQDAGIQYLGNQDPSVTKDVCEIMAMKVHVQKKDGTAQDGTLPIAYCAWHYFEREPYEGEFDVMKQYADIMPVVGLMQVGQEYQAQSDARQHEVGRTIIDGGAEFVIGNSPHWVQDSEVYKDKLIFYSTGNFIFDQLDAETNRGASVVVNMTIDYDENVAKWLALGEECKAHYDNCLQKAQDQKLSKIHPAFTYDLVASTTGFREVTQKAPANVQTAVEERANWLMTLKELGQQ